MKYLKMQFLLLILFLFPSINFSQEGDAPETAWKWYYSRRVFPYDTIPGGAFENAYAQRLALLQSSGYEFPGTKEWKEIGPLPYDFFYGNIHRVSSGRISHVVYDPRDPLEEGRYIYVTGAAGGLWKTEDGGLSWNNKSGDLPSLYAGAFTLDAEHNILYFGITGTPNTWLGAGDGFRIFRSTNEGQNWIQISNGIEIGTAVYKIIISPWDHTGNTLFAAYHQITLMIF